MFQHDSFDKFSEQWLSAYQATGKSIFCRAGCSGCCNLAVHSTFPEAVAIARSLSTDQSRRIAAYMNRLAQALAAVNDMKGYLKQHKTAIGPCPFLGLDNCCEIYAARPLSCRSLLSTRPAEWCVVDFNELDQWDKQAYESALHREVVAWPTHYVAATQDFARNLETQLLAEMKQQQGWSLFGNFVTMVWLEDRYQLSQSALTSEQVQAILVENHLDSALTLTLSE